MAFRIYNTISGQKEIFEPVQPGKVGIYVCGPTVYKDSHIGHAVGPVIFDALKKYLSYKGYQVTLVINITDVDDKLIIESAQKNISVGELAEQVSQGYFQAMEKLGVNSVDIYPRATEHIDDIINLIQRLSESDTAYEVSGDVYFDIEKCPDYGKLSHRKSEDQMEGSRQLEGSGKRNSADFALWKKVADDEIGWDSPWGRGRPGWHIECSAMSMKYLGQTFDIHGGGMDLIFPHHENEIAQSETATGQCFAKYWMHNGLTRIKTKARSGEWKAEKMSKSLGNIKSLKELLNEIDPQAVRFFLLNSHYRRPIDFSDEAIQATLKGMMNIYRMLQRVERIAGNRVFGEKFQAKEMQQALTNEDDQHLMQIITQAQLRYLETLEDDFNTAGAIAVLHDLTAAINRFIDRKQLEGKASPKDKIIITQAARMLTSLGSIIGLFVMPLSETSGQNDQLTGQIMEIMIELRNTARREKNFALADTIRDRLKDIGITLEDRPDGTGWQVTA